jgi:hypothetical protein
VVNIGQLRVVVAPLCALSQGLVELPAACLTRLRGRRKRLSVGGKEQLAEAVGGCAVCLGDGLGVEARRSASCSLIRSCPLRFGRFLVPQAGSVSTSLPQIRQAAGATTPTTSIKQSSRRAGISPATAVDEAVDTNIQRESG